MTQAKAWFTEFGQYELLFNDAGAKDYVPSQIKILNDDDSVPEADFSFETFCAVQVSSGQNKKINTRVKVVSVDQPKTKKTYTRRTIVVEDELASQDEITFWSAYADRQFTVGKTLLIFNLELTSRKVSMTDERRQANAWFDAMILACTGDFEEYAL